MTSTTTARRRFVVHYLQMLAAMGLGMLTLHPLWMWVAGDAAPGSWLLRTEVDALAMATAMTVPMVLWMLWRRHGTVASVLMAVAMYAGFVLLFPVLWLGWIGATGLMVGGHVLMLVLMAVAMLVAPHDHDGHGSLAPLPTSVVRE